MRPDEASDRVIASPPLKPAGKGKRATVDVTDFTDPVVIERADLALLQHAFRMADGSKIAGGAGPGTDPVGPPPAEDAFRPAENNGV